MLPAQLLLNSFNSLNSVFYLKTTAPFKVAYITTVLSAEVFSFLAAVRNNFITDCLHGIYIKS